MAATTEPTSTAIEAFFTPSTRSKDANFSWDDGFTFPKDYTELELLPGLSPEDALLSGGSNSLEDVCRFLHFKVLWMTPDVYITSPDLAPSSISRQHVLSIRATNQDQIPVNLGSLSVFVHSRHPAAATSTNECLVRLLGTSGQHDVRIEQNRGCSLAVTGPTLARMFEESQGNLRRVTFVRIDWNEELIRAMATVSRSDLKVILKTCRLTGGAGSHAAFIECLQSDSGPTELDCCCMDRRIIAEAITGNTRLVSLKQTPGRTYGVVMDALFLRAIANSRGLVNLDMSCNAMSDEHWSMLCESLRTHPAITSLILCETHSSIEMDKSAMSDEQKRLRTLELANVLQENTILHTIGHSVDELDSGCYDELIRPRLETNLYGPRVLAIKKADSGLLRRMVLGRALSLHSVRSKPNLVWMLLSQNVDITCGGGNV